MPTIGENEHDRNERRVKAEIDERRAMYAFNFTRFIGWGNVLATVVFAGAWLLFPQYKQLLLLAIVCALLMTSSLAYSSLRRQGYARLGAFIAILALTVASMVSFIALPKLGPGSVVAYVLVMILACFSLDKRDAVWIMVVVTFLVTANILVADIALEWFLPLDRTLETSLGIAATVIAFVAVALTIRQIVTEQESFFYTSRMASWEIEKRVEVEKEQRHRLQQSHQEIEARETAEREQREHLSRVLVQVHDAANSLSSASTEILTAMTHQATGAGEQSAAIAQMTTTVDELKSIAEQSVSRAQEVAGASQRTVQVSRDGQRAVDETANSMAQIKARVEGIAENILALSEQTQQIDDIISTVNDIAAQSNILALNASVEAARAGESGKGFAVVAVEVRNLAEQSRQATAQVKAILSDIQKATNATVMATEEGTKGVDVGMQLTSQAGGAIEQLGVVIEESAQAASQMVAGGRQQATGVAQMALAMQNINQVMRQSLVNTRQSEKAAQELTELAHRLAGIVGQYQT